MEMKCKNHKGTKTKLQRKDMIEKCIDHNKKIVEKGNHNEMQILQQKNPLITRA